MDSSGEEEVVVVEEEEGVTTRASTGAIEEAVRGLIMDRTAATEQRPVRDKT